MSNITLPRAVVEQVQEALKELDYASEPYVNEIARTTLAALDAGLAEPPAKPEPATMQQIVATHRTTYGAPWLDEFDRAWKAAERFHGITKEDGK